MEFRIAQAHDLDRLRAHVRSVMAHMHSRGLDHWRENEYPTDDMIKGDIRQGALHILEDGGELVASVTINRSPPVEYRGVKWLTKDGNNLIVHRLAVAPDWQGKGISHRVMDYIEEHAEKERYISIRLDTYHKNMPGMRLYMGRGYLLTGNVTYPGYTEPFICFEKVLAR